MMAANDSIELINQFYTSFQRHDHAGMIACYHPQIEFSDPVFTDLKGNEAKAMWHMLVERGADLTLEFSKVQAQGNTGSAHWEARYSFSASKRPVHNIIDAAFTFQDGKIIRHQDSFDFWRWSRMALGTPGVLLGWSPPIQNRVRETAMQGLRAFMAKHPEYQR